MRYVRIGLRGVEIKYYQEIIEIMNETAESINMKPWELDDMVTGFTDGPIEGLIPGVTVNVIMTIWKTGEVMIIGEKVDYTHNQKTMEKVRYVGMLPNEVSPTVQDMLGGSRDDVSLALTMLDLEWEKVTQAYERTKVRRHENQKFKTSP